MKEEGCYYGIFDEINKKVEKIEFEKWIKKDDKEILVKLEDLEFLIEFFDYQRLITRGDEFNLNKVHSKQQGLNNPHTYY